MARSNSFFGLRRGSTKSLTFSVLKGQQITKDRVSDISNPRTVPQMANRLTFATATRFYTKAVRNLFKFAFEDKTERENDFNAFMRYNATRGCASTKGAIYDSYPALGNFMLTRGSLLAPQWGWNGHTYPNIILDRQSAVPSTFGELCQRFITYNNQYQNGDIVTIVQIRVNATPAQSIDAAIAAGDLFTDINPNDQPIWNITQFVLDTDSIVPLTYYSDIITSVSSDDSTFIKITTPAEYGFTDDAVISDSKVYAFAVIVSRNLPNAKVMVSDSTLVGNSATEVAISIGTSEQWKLYCAENYVETSAMSNPTNILQGSLTSGSITKQTSVTIKAGTQPNVTVDRLGNSSIIPSSSLRCYYLNNGVYILCSPTRVFESGGKKFIPYKYGNAPGIFFQTTMNTTTLTNAQIVIDSEIKFSSDSAAEEQLDFLIVFTEDKTYQVNARIAPTSDVAATSQTAISEDIEQTASPSKTSKKK